MCVSRMTITRSLVWTLSSDLLHLLIPPLPWWYCDIFQKHPNQILVSICVLPKNVQNRSDSYCHWHIESHVRMRLMNITWDTGRWADITGSTCYKQPDIDESMEYTIERSDRHDHSSSQLHRHDSRVVGFHEVVVNRNEDPLRGVSVMFTHDFLSNVSEHQWCSHTTSCRSGTGGP